MKDDKRERGTGSLRRRGATWWVRYYHRGRLVEESARTRDEAQARKFLRGRLKAADTPMFVEPAARKLTFEDLMALAQADAVRRGNRTAARLGTAAKPSALVRHLADHFAGWQTLAITADHVDRYADERIAGGAKPATVNRELALLRRAFRLAVRKGLLPTAPAVTLRPEAGNEREGFVDPADFEALLGELRQRDATVADLVEAGYLTLLRRGSVRRLAWGDFRLEVDHGRVVGGELRLPGTKTKNKRPLALPLGGRLLALVDRRWQARTDDAATVFPGIGSRRFRKVWSDAAIAIGQPTLIPHDLRRSGARTLIRAGVPQDVVLRLGGWRTRSMLTRYNIVDSADLADAQARMDAVLASPGYRRVLPLRRVS